jgi:hypothetical protein
MKNILALFAVIFGISSVSNASLMVEPYLGYEFGKQTNKAVGGSTETTSDSTNPALGLRLGYSFMLPWVALDYTMGSGTIKATAGDTDFSRTSLAAVVGVDLPVLVRAWAGYGFTNDFTLKGSGGLSDTKVKGTYTKVGVGTTMLPFVSINLEYIMHKATKINLAGSGEVDVDTVYSTFDNNTYMLSVSLPLDF